jgi:hypothetical protein
VLLLPRARKVPRRHAPPAPQHASGPAQAKASACRPVRLLPSPQNEPTAGRDDGRADVLARGADRYIEKGADPDAIAAMIEEVATVSGGRVEA